MPSFQRNRKRSRPGSHSGELDASLAELARQSFGRAHRSPPLLLARARAEQMPASLLCRSVVYYLSWVVFAITVYGMSGLEHETFYDPHAILELSSDTTDMKVITKQYRKMTLDFHPDRCPANSKAETDELCAERFMKITKAKEA